MEMKDEICYIKSGMHIEAKIMGKQLVQIHKHCNNQFGNRENQEL